MRTTRWLAAASLILFLIAPHVLAAQRSAANRPRRPVQHRAGTTIDNSSRMDVNSLDMVVTNHGSLALDLNTGNAGLIYPKGSTKTAVFAAGFWMGAKVAGETRLAVGEYSQEFTPGPMADSTFQPDNPAFKNYRIERGGVGYADYLANAVPQGAPVDGQGQPLLLGDATIWSVFNDADPTFHINEAGTTAPLGIEVQQTVFAFNRTGPLANMIFVKWLIINKGSNTLDSSYVSFWSDPDLGGFTDDLVGCDTTLSLGYCYNATNSDQQYGSRPPAVGYDFFKGPRVEVSPGVFKTLGMTSFNKYINGTDPAAATETYNYMRGLHADGTPVHVNDDTTLAVTTYQVSGLNPGAPSGPSNWLDSGPADRRLMLSSGPFTMAPGDTQEVVAAIIIGQGSDRLSSITDLKNKDALAQTVFDLNFDICPPPPAPTVYVQPLDRGVRLVWGSDPVGFSCTDSTGAIYEFEGIRVWQLASNDAGSDPTVLATYDVPDGIANIYGDELNTAAGGKERILKVAGSDGGLQFSLDITSDKIRGGKLINNKDYYYAVTAYAYDSNDVTPFFIGVDQVGIVSGVLESARTPIQVQPRSSSAVFSVGAGAVSSDPVLNPDGRVDVDQLLQNDIQQHAGELYRISLDDQERWMLENVSQGDTLLADQANVSGDFDNPVTEGFMVRVTAPRGAAEIGELRADSTITDMTPENQDSTGTWHFVDFDGLDGFTPFFGYPTNHDYEIRILPDTTQYAWTYASGEVSFVTTFRVPFEVWDLGFNTPSDPSDDVKMSIMARDRDLSGSWTWDDRFYIRDIPYNTVAWTSPGTKSTDYGDGSEQTLGNFQPALDDTNYTEDWPPPTTIRVYARRFTASDRYEFRNVPVGSAPGTVVGDDIKKILAVPNPYYAHSAYELNQFDRVMKFTNIPAAHKVTIRIFNLAGDLVRTIRREATTADEMAHAEITWDLNTDRNLPVASGVYIYRVDVAGVGSKTDRLAVFIEQERLDNF